MEVTESLKVLLNQPSKAMVPQDFSRVGSAKANGILASLEIVECEGNVLDPIVVSESATASWDFDFSAGTYSAFVGHLHAEGACREHTHCHSDAA